MVGNVQQPVKKVGRPSRPNSKRHQIMVDNMVWKWLDGQGASETIEKLAREKMEEQARERINGMDFTDEQTEFIFSDWPNWDEHINWLLTAIREEIISWIEASK